MSSDAGSSVLADQLLQSNTPEAEAASVTKTSAKKAAKPRSKTDAPKKTASKKTAAAAKDTGKLSWKDMVKVSCCLIMSSFDLASPRSVLGLYH